VMAVAREDGNRQHHERYAPTTWDGNNLWNGNMNPVTLVATAVIRRSLFGSII
jgi:hypothetical protein